MGDDTNGHVLLYRGRSRAAGGAMRAVYAVGQHARAQPDERYYTLCEDHGVRSTYPSRREAYRMAAKPGWCPACAARAAENHA